MIYSHGTFLCLFGSSLMSFKKEPDTPENLNWWSFLCPTLVFTLQNLLPHKSYSIVHWNFPNLSNMLNWIIKLFYTISIQTDIFLGGSSPLQILSSTTVLETHAKGDKVSESLYTWNFLCFTVTSEWYLSAIHISKLTFFLKILKILLHCLLISKPLISN